MTLLKDYQIRVIANACITLYDRAEGEEKDINKIVSNYNFTDENKTLVLAQIYAFRTDIEQTQNA